MQFVTAKESRPLPSSRIQPAHIQTTNLNSNNNLRNNNNNNNNNNPNPNNNKKVAFQLPRGTMLRRANGYFDFQPMTPHSEQQQQLPPFGKGFQTIERHVDEGLQFETEETLNAMIKADIVTLCQERGTSATLL
jgi:hypothetical protein